MVVVWLQFVNDYKIKNKMSNKEIVFGKRFKPNVQEQPIQLFVPKNDKNKIETNLAQDRREAYEECAKDEVPKLRNINAVLASDYFRYGWEAAVAKYSKGRT